MPEHERYVELCALAATAQLSKDEYDDLAAHVQRCDGCRAALAEYQQLVGLALPQSRSMISELRDLAKVRPLPGFRRRFLQRARGEGIRVSERAEAREHPWLFTACIRFVPQAATIAVVILIALFAYNSVREKKSTAAMLPAMQPSTPVSEVEELHRQNVALRADLEQAKQLAESRGRELASIQQARTALAQRVSGLERLIQDAQRKAESLGNSLKTANAKSADLDSRLIADAKMLADMRIELGQLRAMKSGSDATLVAQQAKIEELSEKVRLQNAMLDMDRQLLAANRDVRDLMGARDLHITDVHDFDGRGTQSKVFGRIFYTQGKSLIFYAFDLGDRRLANAKYSFQAWGQQEANQHSARSLGLMYLDDKTQKRWVLKVDDPNLLKQIDSVFVTVEPAGGGKKPSGQKLLYAYLGNKPNHP